MIKRILADAIIFAAIIVIGLEVDALRRSQNEKQYFRASPVQYGELVPDKTEYAPGDLITFQYDRTTISLDDAHLLMLTIYSFENLDTGEIFTGTLASRIIRQDGSQHLRATRRLSTDATPGTYAFEGWASIQGKDSIRAVPYSSQIFTVRPKPH